jgi:hypothetical protein
VLPVLLALLVFAPAADASHPRVQSHSMIHVCCTPDREQEHFLAAAKASGATMIRLDVEVHGIVRWPWGHDYSNLDRVIELARRHDIRILGVLSGTPAGMTECPPGIPFEHSWKCPAADPAVYAEQVVAIMEHAGDGVFAWEFWNEPDLGYMYVGSAEAYGRTLGAIYEQAAGRFRITSGGVSDVGLPFLQRAIEAGARFDIGNVHLRWDNVAAKAASASDFFGDRPVWVTEHGYPSHPDPDAQLRYLEQSIPSLRAGGADEVFVTLRDTPEFGPASPFASEGIIGKPAWDLIVALNAEPSPPPDPGSRQSPAALSPPAVSPPAVSPPPPPTQPATAPPPDVSPPQSTPPAPHVATRRQRPRKPCARHLRRWRQTLARRALVRYRWCRRFGSSKSLSASTS